MSQPFKLYRLQNIDSQLDKARAQLAEIAAALQDTTAVENTRQKLADVQKVFDKADKALQLAEQEVTAQQARIKNNQNLLYGGSIKNPKELEDLQNEAAALQRYLSVLEDRQLEKMAACEEAENALRAAQALFDDTQISDSQRKQALQAEQFTLTADVERLEGERAAALEGIPPEDLELYSKLRQTRGGIAVAKMSNAVCSACGTTLPQGLAQAARSPNQITRCDTCGRILHAG